MKVLTLIARKVLPKKLMTKLVAKQLEKAPIVDCKIFSQAEKRKISGQSVIKDFIDQSGHTTISLNDLQKLNPKTGKTGQARKKFVELAVNKLHENSEISKANWTFEDLLKD